MIKSKNAALLHILQAVGFRAARNEYHVFMPSDCLWSTLDESWQCLPHGVYIIDANFSPHSNKLRSFVNGLPAPPTVREWIYIFIQPVCCFSSDQRENQPIFFMQTSKKS